MSEQEKNVALAQSAVEAYQRGDVETFLASMDPEVEVFNSPELPNAGTFHGREGFLRWTSEWLEAWDEFQIEPQGYEPVGERHVLIRQRQIGKGKGSGIEVDMEAWYMIEYRDGLAVRMHLYPTREQALEAARDAESG